MFKYLKLLPIVAPLLTLAACASVPNGPSNMALPGTGKSFDQFRQDDQSCRAFAQGQIGGVTANQAANSSFAASTATGTAIGAAVGALAGHGEGAGIGAATGLAMGSVIGANESAISANNVQGRYDNAYTQCMYAAGHRVPVTGRFESRQKQTTPNADSTLYFPPPPPPDYHP